MLHRFSLAATALLLTCDLAAQASPARFTLSAGRHDLGDLAELLGVIARAPLQIDAETAEAMSGRSLTLQRELQLDAETWLDVASALLFDGGFALARGRNGEPDRILATADLDALLTFAAERSAAAVLERPNRIEWVRVRVPIGSPEPGFDAPSRPAAFLRPLFGVRGAPWSIRILEDDQATTLIGPSDQVGLALRMLAVNSGAVPPTRPAVEWPQAGEIAWPGGTPRIRDLIATLCERLDCNVLGAAPDGRVQLGDAATLSPRAWFARATYALREADLVLMPIAAEQRVFALHFADAPETRHAIARAPLVMSDQAPDPADGVAPVTVLHRLRSVEPGAAANALRPMLKRGVTMGALGTDWIYLATLTDDLAPMLDTLRAADRDDE